MTAQELLVEIRDGLAASAWSDAIQAARDGSVTLYKQEGNRWWLDVALKRPLPFRVELDLDVGDWHCPCKSSNGTCAHAAAAALALQHAEREGKPLPGQTSPSSPSPAPSIPSPPGPHAPAPRAPTPPPAPTGPRPHLRHRLSVSDNRWQLETFIIPPTFPSTLPPTREQLMAGDPTAEVLKTTADLQILNLKRAGISPERLTPLLQALAMSDDVWVGTRRARVLLEPIRPKLVAMDHPQGLLVKLELAPKVLETLKGNQTLVLLEEPSSPLPLLRPLGSSTLPGLEAEVYERGRLFTGPQILQFFSDVLPRLQSLTQVEMRTHLKPQTTDMRPYARLTLSPGTLPGGLDVLPSITYGSPPLAVVIGERLHVLQGAKGLPQRQLGLERALLAQLDRLRLEPGKMRQLQGEQAIRFVAEVLPRFEKHLQGRVENPHLAAKMRVYEGRLRPRWEVDPKNGQLTLQFALEPRVRSKDLPLDSSGKPATSPRDARPPQLPETPLLASADQLMQAWRQESGLVPLMDGGFARLPSDWMQQYGDVLSALLETEGQPERTRAPMLAQLAEEGSASPDAEALRQALLARQKIEPTPIPPTLKATLRPYQHEGLSWLKHLEQQQLNGILADDMGLGKTLQTLALLLTDPSDAGPTLVVAPTSVLDNWLKEAARFAPSLTTRLYHGEKRTVEDLTSARLIVTSYALMRLDHADLAKIPWHRIILDEAQAIKNPDSQSARTARSLVAKHRLTLTGTPVENRLEELWSLLEFLNPGLLGSRKTFDALYGGTGNTDARAVARLRVRVQPFLLRRHKKDVARDLPGKTEVVLKARLSRDERKVYDAVRLAGRKEIQKLTNTQGIKGKKLQILEILLRMRQACCHAGLVPGSGELGSHASSKIKLLIEQLEVILSEGHKALVFSQWTGLLDKVEPVLKAADIDWVRLDGTTRDRAAVVERFQSDDGPGVFLISLKAGGTGLNLTAADYVYHLDPWWNPAVEDQATDRAYRIGQTRPVVVSRLIAADSVEERVMMLQEKKRAIADAALGGESLWLDSLSDSELEDLLEG